jgi:predicted exporter
VSDPRRFVRQTQVIGEDAQRALLAARVVAPANATTADYLARAGITFEAAGVATADAGARADDLVAAPPLRDAADALLGAFAAVETIKALAGVGRAGHWPAGLRLDAEEE